MIEATETPNAGQPENACPMFSGEASGCVACRGCGLTDHPLEVKVENKLLTISIGIHRLAKVGEWEVNWPITKKVKFAKAVARSLSKSGDGGTAVMKLIDAACAEVHSDGQDYFGHKA